MSVTTARAFAPLLLAAASTCPVPSKAETSVTCERVLQPGDKHEFTCPLKAVTKPQKGRFVVELSGGHDDSMSSIEVRHGFKELSCEPGSKTRSDGEDGDIVLDCRFTLQPAASASASASAPPAAAGFVAVTLKAYHTHFERYSFKLD